MSRRLAVFLVVALLQLLRQFGVAVGQSNVSNSLGLSSFLYANQSQTLVSPNGVFQLGFYSLSGNTDSSNNTLAIRYASPIRTLVWMADRNSKVSDSAYLQLSSDGNLVVSDDPTQSAQVVWASNTKNLNVVGAYLRDTGNLVLLDKRNSTVWQSFDTPTNTLLPGQKYSPNASRKLQSWKTAEDWGEGRYICTWDNNNQFMLVWNMTNTGTYTDWPTNWKDYPQGYPIKIGNIDTLRGLKFVNSTTNVPTLILESTQIYGLALRRVTLDRDGGLRIYNWTLGQSSNWSVEADAVQDHCSAVHGVCGPYGICSPVSVGLLEPIQCMCPNRGFELIDPTDSYQGCKPIVQLLTPQCSSSDSVEFVRLTSIDYPLADYNTPDGSILDFSTCNQMCLAGCQCNGFVYSYNKQKCWLKNGPLWNGHYFNAGADSGDRNSYLKISALPPAPVPTPPSSGPPQNRNSRKLLVALASSLGSSLGFICLLLIVYFFLRRRKLRNIALERKLETLRSSPVLKFTYSELKAATNNFREEIGKGGFGSVFKGEVGQAKYSVAVKRLENLNPAGEKGFLSEVMTIGSIHHVNLVRLHGYCAEGAQRLLVYEYVELGSLDKFIFRGQKTPILEWRVRFQIVMETARALMYLHEDCREYKIIHRDIKPQNILLDKFFHVKLADFGLARLMNKEHTRTMTLQGSAGTPGYLAPECFFEHAPLTPKIDVFSYGMVVLEIIGGRRNFIYNFPENPADYFPAWAWEKMKSGDHAEIVDPCLGADFDMNQVRLLVQVAFRCINEKPEVRPSMRLVLRMLEGLVQLADQPVPRPSYLLDWAGSATSQSDDEEQHFLSGSIFSTRSNLSGVGSGKLAKFRNGMGNFCQKSACSKTCRFS